MQSHSSVSSKLGATAENGALTSLKEISSSSKSSNGDQFNSANGDYLGLNGRVHKTTFSKRQLSKTDEEIIRLIGQHLCSIGFQKASEALISESGCKLEHATVSKFREQIMDGQWSKAEHTLVEMKPILKHQRHLQKMKFLLMEQKFLELVEDGKLLDALHCLRNQITPLRIYINKVHQLSGFLMISNPQELHRSANWDGKGLKSRSKLLEKLQGYLPMSVMMPPNRLETLLTQAVEYQQSKCIFHNSSEPPKITSYSLLMDHTCLARRNFPAVTKQILNNHCDEVWFCKFSQNGKMLATGSKDSTVIIWDVDPVTHRVTYARSLSGHTYGVGYLSWSHDDKFILACGTEEGSGEIWLWNAKTGELVNKMNNSSDDSLSACCWAPDGKKYVTGGTKGQFYQCDLNGNVLQSWDGVRVQCLGHLPDNKTVLASDTQHRIRAYNLEDQTDHDVLKEDNPIMSFGLSSDGRLAVLNVATQGVHVWDVDDQILIRKYQGAVQGFYTIFATFGGSCEQYVASGSEDNQVYIWHRSRENPIETLTGHTKTVNCVSWSRAVPSILASVSDDGTVRIWGPQDSSESDSDDEDTSYGSDL